MSLLSTAPETNPTVMEVHSSQVMKVKDAVEIIDFTFDDISQIVDTKTFQLEQQDWFKLAAKNKFVSVHNWPINTISNWLNISIDRLFVDKLIPVGRTFNSFNKFTRILISIKPTSNSLMQGLSAISFLPIPRAAYLADLFNYSISNQPERIFQVPGKKFISPNNSNELNFLIPVNFPFEFFRWDPGSLALSPASYQDDYISGYPFGSLHIDTVVPLTTKTPLTHLVYTVSASVVDLQTAGLNFGF